MIAVVCFLAAAIFIGFYYQSRRNENMKPEHVEVTCDGEMLGSYPLEENATIEIETDYGLNVMFIEDGKVSVTDADCNNHNCMEQGIITKSGESIICLPHRLVITITGEAETEYDVIVR
ncbi:MAG TPA: NusG domain II-containing protein [Lachnospiraceae bacterium]|nr:NusG domain II-containing protein [Lachnospiraceae bacterium]